LLSITAGISGWQLVPQPYTRRGLLGLGLAAASAPLLPLQPASALIKGSAPPAGGFKAKTSKCKSIDECEDLGEKEREQMSAGADETFQRTTGGDRYRDMHLGDGKTAREGDAVEIRYRVMRLGTRARDGLSGEGQTIFSYGFGEDDDKEGDKQAVLVKKESTVAGIADALVGMKPGGKRRVLVRPERGWKDSSAACADIVFKADIGAAVENEAACITKNKVPLPRTYGAKQRFARRFDESLLVELDLVGFVDPKAASKASGQYYDRCEQNPFTSGCSE
jgi:hypothetical protein